MIYAASAADRARLGVIGGQPGGAELLKQHRADGVAAEDVLGAYVFRDLRGYVIMKDPRPVSALIPEIQESTLRRIGGLLGVRQFDAAAWYRRTFHVWPLEDPLLSTRGSPCGDDITASVARSETRYINRRLLTLIDGLMAEYSEVGVVYGAGHFAALQAALSSRYGQPSFDLEATPRLGVFGAPS
ncbi:hypothetical protein C5708_01455 [Caulobacter sp. CCUG 60055]|uniref:hypothetical protein n=1 Tax=Caulobacter sp. CCUG 60055 TaxID=2100090 RepID=UPI001FA740D8|nr:hypothetical protein [Caulobacter sp. CCUG 60055]MCI3178915.1 hypothetical protein [Caulobacter sp. CCUG 60055]